MPERAPPAAPVRPFWSGTITFGLVSIPVSFYAGARARQKSMRMVDTQGHPLGRRYVHSESEKPLDNDDIVRGYETDDGEMVVISDEEFASAAPETSRDIELSRFVPFGQISPAFFVRPYFLAPETRSGKAYSLLAQTMERAGKVGIGRFVMRGHEYLLAIVAEGGALRAETLRYFDELRSPEAIGLPEPSTPPKKLVNQLAADIDRLLENRLGIEELEDKEAEALHELAERKLKKGEDVIDIAEPEEPEEGGAEIIDLVQLLRRSLGGKVTPGDAGGGPQPAGARRRPRRRTAENLDSRTRQELYRLAADLRISGRSKMSKQQLARAVEAATGERAAA